MLKCRSFFIGLLCAAFCQVSLALDTHMAVYVKDLNRQHVIKAADIDTYYAPSSNLKLFTAISSYLVLKPNFTFDTSLIYDPKLVQNGSLKGNLILQFSGDPLLTHQELYQLIATLNTKGIKKIEGNIELNTQGIDDNAYPDGVPNDQRHICYAGPVNAINLDRNCIHFNLFHGKPGEKVEIPAEISQGFSFVNTTITKTDPHCPIEINNKGNTFFLSGCMSPNAPPIRFNLSIPDSVDYASKRVRKTLSALGITLTGTIVESNSTVNLPAIVTHHSKPLSQLLTIMLKHSDNLIANALFKAVGQHYYGGTATWTKAIHAEKAVLQKYAGINPKELYIYDGSGFSFYNFVTARQIVTLLEYAHRQPELNKMMMQSLPISSVDGSLHRRIPSLKGMVHAKTGTRRDSSALSGYIIKNGHVAVFSVLVNDNFKLNNSTALEDSEVQKAAAVL